MSQPTKPASPASPASPTKVEPILTTKPPEPERKVTQGDVISPDDFFEAFTEKKLEPAAVEGVTVRGTPIYVRRMTAGDLDRYYSELEDVPESEYRAGILVASIVRDNGSRVFEQQHRTKLCSFPAEISTKIIERFYEVNGLGRRGK